MILSLVLTLFSFKAFSDDNYLGELSFGEEYCAPKGSTTYGFFIAPKTGAASMLFKGTAAQCLYSDEACTSQIYGTFTNNFNSAGYEYRVTEGVTYYIKLNNVINPDMYFTLYMDGVATQPFKQTDCSPATNGTTTYNLTKYETMFVRYSREIASDYTVEMTYTSKGGTEITKTLSPNYTYIQNLTYLYVRMREVLVSLINDSGAEGISPEAPFTVSFKVTDKLGQYAEEADANGWISFSYLCGYIPTTVTSATFPTEFLSYWPEGDPSGIATIVFDNEISKNHNGAVPMVSLEMGEREGGELGLTLYMSSFPAKVEGNTVTVDLTGVRRSYDDILNGNNSFDTMTVTVSNLYDINGQMVESNLQGNSAKYVVNIPFKNLEKERVVSDWVPPVGSDLNSYSNMEIWISGLNVIGFDGFTVECTNGSTTEILNIGMADVTVSDETPDGNEAVFTFAIPEGAKTAESVKIYPTNLQSINGYEYSTYLSGLFNTFTFTAVEPTQGSDLETLKNQKVEAIFNYASEYPNKFVTFYVKDLNASEPEYEILVAETPMDVDSYGKYSVMITDKATMYLNHTYEGVFTAWENESAYNSGKAPIGTATVEWYGKTPAYQNGVAILESITPAEDADLNGLDGVFVLTFDSPVRIDDEQSFFTVTMTDPQPFSSVTPLGDDIAENDGYSYSTEWEVTIPESYITEGYPQVKLTLVVLDTDERVVLGNSGRGEDSVFEFNYSNTLSVNDIETTETGEYTVYNLTGVRVLKTDNVNALRSLSPGIYIVNGKKVKI